MKHKRWLGLAVVVAVMATAVVFTGVAVSAPNKIKAADPSGALAQRLQERTEKVKSAFERKVTQEEREGAAARLAALVAGEGLRPAAAPDGPVVGQGDAPDYFSPWVPNWNYSPPLRKFVDTLPGVGEANANNLGQYLPQAVPDTTSYPGVTDGLIAAATADYYEIALVQYTEKLHSDLPPTTLRGYVQIETPAQLGVSKHIALTYPNGDPILDSVGQQVYAVDRPHYMGPLIVAQRNKPVRLKFTNYLPTGSGGDLFIPVDPTVMGAGMGDHMIMPMALPGGFMVSGTTATIMAMEPHQLAVGRKVWLEGFTPAAFDGAYEVTSVIDEMSFQIQLRSALGDPTAVGHVMEMYTENRSVVHLHGGRTPWISDGTPHQWITPAGEDTAYPQGASARDVPDMTGYEAADDGTITYYYTNQQSARLMFYHDHVYGITRLNVYAGEAAAYLIEDDVEQSLIQAGLIPAEQIPLVIQDKTFVDASTIGDLDPTWRWGTGADNDSNGYPDYKTGDLWLPHVYMPAQNPIDISGMAAMGRWHYGPWFWPPTAGIKYAPTANPYYDPAWPWEPAEVPNVPDPSMGMEAFNDTPTVNGTAYPTLTVEPKAYRFRILNAANDRFWNLQLYEADPAVTSPVPGVGLSEVRMVPASNNPGDPTWPQNFSEGNPTWPVDGREGGVPDWNLRGPDWVQIGNESGVLPMPAVLTQRPIDWNVDVTLFNAGIVNSGSLILGPAERADVVVDFSAFAGKTLILYNDAPAAFPAPDPRYDYYTNSPDLSDTGGYWGTPVGYGPNTRTIMQIKVAGGASDTQVISGWNLIAGGPGSEVLGTTLYGYDGTQYSVVNAADMVPGKGYWAEYAANGTVTVKTVPAPVSVSLTAGWNLIGNPTGNTVILPAGVDAYTFVNGSYQSVTTLLSGQGAWVNVATPQDITLVSNGTGPASTYDVATLNAAWESTDTQQGVFKSAQDPIIVAQGEAVAGRDQYNRAYNSLFPATSPLWGLSRIQDKSLSFQTIEGATVTIPMREKAIQDEMGETFDERGRMAGNLGVMLPNPQPAGQTFVLQEYSDPATEIFTVTATPLTPPLAGDGTQIWKITHNGVDTHPIHFHLFDVQVINRVGWDNLITLPAANELGWKETIRVSPLEDTIVAMRPVIPELPFKLGDSIREYEPILGRDVTSDMFTGLDPLTGQALASPQQNNLVNFGWEYMWHCHILSHEEMMMMRTTAVYVAPAAASGLEVTGTTGGVELQWTNNRSMVNPMYLSLGPLTLPAATNFIVQRATDPDFTVDVQAFEVVKTPKAAYADQEVVAYTDTSASTGTTYYYRVRAETDQGYSVWSAATTATP